MGKTKLSDS